MPDRPPKETLPMPEPPGAGGTGLVGRLVGGRYRVQRTLGDGAMGTVYQVADERTRMRYALKVLKTDIAGAYGDARARFEREARATSLLQHPNIVAVIAFGRLDGDVPYLLMEYVDGHALGALIDRGPLPARRALAIARQMVSGLGYAHALGLVHRDIKPDNVMIEESSDGSDQVKLLDFGIVKLVGELAAAEVGGEELTQVGVRFGTPEYMPPEQIFGSRLDARADLYAAGCLLFEMLTGRPPFASEERAEVIRGHIGATPPTIASTAAVPASACTPALEAAVAGALAKKLDQRFADAAAMIAALDAAARSLSP